MQNELLKKIHETAKSKGWWEKPRGDKELLTLVVSELSEAVEEMRSNSAPFYGRQADGVIYAVTGLDIAAFKHPKVIDGNIGEELMKPEGELIELADVVIRLFDIAGSIELDYEKLLSEAKMDKSLPLPSDIDFYFDMISVATMTNLRMNHKILCLVVAAEKYCESKGWDLYKAIEIKMKYNETRPQRHGWKKY